MELNSAASAGQTSGSAANKISAKKPVSIRRRGLQVALLLAFAACLAVVSIVQLATRHFIELPQLYEQEYANDLNAVQQVKRVLASEVTRKREVAIDNGHWVDAREFIQSEKDGPDYQRFTDTEYGHSETSHVVPRVSGYAYFTLNGELFFESNFDLTSWETGESLPLPLAAFLPIPTGEYGATNGGFIDTSSGPILFVVAGITNDETTLPPAGYLVVWRFVDDLFLDELIGPLGIEFDHSPTATQGDLVAAIRANPEGVLPRDETGMSHWIIDDVHGEPLLLVRQATPPRTFNDGLISTSSIFGFSASALLLIVFALLVSRRVINPIVDLSAFVEEVASSEDFTRRLSFNRKDEIGAVANQFDQLLERVELQEAALKEQNANLEALAEHDSLTGLQNRRVFDRVLQQDWSLATRTRRPLTCIMIDVDCFKPYNDHYGHQMGDSCLQDIAKGLEEKIQRATDNLCRYGGEEFVVLLLDTDNADGLAIAYETVAHIEQLALPHAYSDCAEVVTISAGVATLYPSKGSQAEDLVKLADEALYLAKQNGRNRAASSEPAPAATA